MKAKALLVSFILSLVFVREDFSQTTSTVKETGDRIQILKRQLKVNPSDGAARYELAKLFLTADDYGEVIDLYKNQFEKQECRPEEYKIYAVARIRNYETMVITGKILSKLPITSLFHNDLSDAREALDRVLAADSADVEAKFFNGVLLRVDGKESQAEKIFLEIVATAPFFKSYIFYDAWLELGELLRKQERWKEANDLLEKRAALDSSDTWPMIRLAWSYIDLKKDEAATGAFYRGLTAITDRDHIEQLYMEAEPIATKEEIEQWHGLTGNQDKLKFLLMFWRSRDPNLVDAVNERLVEHYRRVQHAREFYKKIRPPYFDDRGLVYIRMGPPDKMYAGIITNDESWVYESTGDHFDFVDVGQGMYELRPLSDALPPGLSPMERFHFLYGMLDVRRNYHMDYDKLATKMQNVVNTLPPERTNKQAMNVFISNMMSIEQQLTTQNLNQKVKEKFDFLTDTDPVPINANFASFRSTNTSRLDFYYMIPVEKLKFMSVDNAFDKAFLSVKAKIFDSTYREIHYMEREYRVTQVDSTLQAGYFVIDELRSLLSPGTYLLALDIRNNLNEKIGIYKLRLHVRDYSLPQLMVSDIELSSSVSQQVIIDKFIKPDTKLRVVPNPAGLSLKSKPLTIYYEIYNLTLDNDGKSSYEVSYAIESASRKNIFARLFSGKSRIVSSTLKTGNSTVEREYIGFDISELPGGEAKLTVTVKDILSQRSSNAFTQLKISP